MTLAGRPTPIAPAIGQLNDCLLPSDSWDPNNYYSCCSAILAPLWPMGWWSGSRDHPCLASSSSWQIVANLLVPGCTYPRNQISGVVRLEVFSWSQSLLWILKTWLLQISLSTSCCIPRKEKAKVKPCAAQVPYRLLICFTSCCHIQAVLGVLICVIPEQDNLQINTESPIYICNFGNKVTN